MVTDGSQRLLIATVGGSPEPLVKSILYWQPLKTIFVVSQESRGVIIRIESEVQGQGYPDFRGRSELCVVGDHQDVRSMCEELRRLFQERVAVWRHEGWEIIADITGGTKVMSAALAIAADRFGRCRFSYVGGRDRTEGGLGEVIAGSEEVVGQQNPWEALGIRIIEEADALLQRHAFAAAATLLAGALSSLDDPVRKDKVNVVAALADALSDWDRFRLRKALEKCAQVQRRRPLLEGTFGHLRTMEIIKQLGALSAHCERAMKGATDESLRPNQDLILDLLANAKRRYDEGRWDDATARLYRAIEAIAQLRLAERGFPDTSGIRIEKLPEMSRSRLAPRAQDGMVKLGVQDAWSLLSELGEPAACLFQQRLGDLQKSPLVARNQSILAHGFAPVSEKTTKQLLEIAPQLLGIERIDEVFRWPPP